MRKEIDVCDNCGKSSEDIYSEIGWIHFNKMDFSIQNGRKEDGNAITERHFSPRNDEPTDFCCAKCLLEFMYSHSETRNNRNESVNFNSVFYREFKVILDNLIETEIRIENSK